MPSRREVLRTAAALPALGLVDRARGQAPPAPPPAPPESGLVVRMREPQNLEMPFAELNSFQTPVEKHYVRSHFATPKLDPATFTLSIEGAVSKPAKFGLADLAKFERVEVPLTLECAGNGRVNLVPQARGLQWGSGAVGTATWGGVRLSSVLERVGLDPAAIELIFVGADKGTVADPASPGAIHFDHSVPVAKAVRPEVILATHMNGEPLSLAHGAPLRLVVGGWYGMASVKWLTRIVATKKPYSGFWQSLDYAIFERSTGQPSLTPVTEMQVKSAISRPSFGEVFELVRPARPEMRPPTIRNPAIRVTGAAWGPNPIAKVEFSADGGKTWALTKLVGEEKPLCWRFFEASWAPDGRGPAQLCTRATDVTGATQPMERDPDRRTYMINHIVPVEVTVK